MTGGRGRRWSVPYLLAATLVAMLAITGASADSHQAKVRVVHASPDAPAVDVWINGEIAIAGLAFGEASDYLALDGDDYDVAVTPAGGAATDAVIAATLTLENGTAYTIAAAGVVANIEPLVLMDNLAAPTAGMAHIRVVHASPDAPNVDVAVSAGPVLIENLAFPEASEYLPVDAMTYDLEVRPAGTQDVAIDIAGFSAQAGRIYSVFAIGLAGDGTLTVLPLIDAQYSQGTGGGDPQMPATGAGGTSTSTTSTGTLLAALLGGAFLIGTGAYVVATRRQERVIR